MWLSLPCFAALIGALNWRPIDRERQLKRSRPRAVDRSGTRPAAPTVPSTSQLPDQHRVDRWSSHCSCPVTTRCNRAVALLLKAANRIPHASGSAGRRYRLEGRNPRVGQASQGTSVGLSTLQSSLTTSIARGSCRRKAHATPQTRFSGALRRTCAEFTGFAPFQKRGLGSGQHPVAGKGKSFEMPDWPSSQKLSRFNAPHGFQLQIQRPGGHGLGPSLGILGKIMDSQGALQRQPARVRRQA